MNRSVAALLILAAAGLGGSMASAQTISKMLRQSGLSPADFEMMDAASRSLYETASPQVGKVVSWSNPDSRSRGTARLAALRQNCAYIQSFVYPKGEAPPRELRKRMCKAADGSWVLTP